MGRPGREERSRREASPAVVSGLVLVLLAAALLAWTVSGVVGPVAAQDDSKPLAPPDTSSPRATLTSFRDNAERAAALVLRTYDEMLAERTLFPTTDVETRMRRAEALFGRSTYCLDLSGLAPSTVQRVGFEAMLHLKEVFDRIPLPPSEAIPDAGMIGAATSWTIPDTEIRLVKMSGGPRAGQWLFSRETVDRAAEFYGRVKHLPDLAATGHNFYEFYALTPGRLMPPVWYRAIEQLPPVLKAEWLDQALWQWIALALLMLLTIVVPLLLHRIHRRGKEPVHRFRSSLRNLVVPAVLALVAMLGRDVSEEVIHITGDVLRVADTFFVIVAYAGAAWLVIALCNSLSEWIASGAHLRPHSIDASLIRVAFRVIGIAGAAILLANCASDLGVPLVGVIAGLGVGGLAIALAAQPTIENLIGGIILYMDRPVRVGDSCQFGDMKGTIEEIGLRSTRIRGEDRTVITVTNAEFAKMKLVNNSQRDRFLLKTVLSLRHDTTPEQMRAVLARLRALVMKHEKIDPKTASVRFVSLGAYSRDIELSVDVLTRDAKEFAAIREALFLEVIEQVTAEGAAFALPAQATYVTQETEPADEAETPGPPALPRAAPA